MKAEKIATIAPTALASAPLVLSGDAFIFLPGKTSVDN